MMIVIINVIMFLFCESVDPDVNNMHFIISNSSNSYITLDIYKENNLNRYEHTHIPLESVIIESVLNNILF